MDGWISREMESEEYGNPPVPSPPKKPLEDVDIENQLKAKFGFSYY